jgi:glycosidase
MGEERVGFTTGTPWNDPFEDYAERNVAAQEEDPDSILSHYRTLIELWNSHEALQGDGFVPVVSDSNKIYAYLRPGEESTIMVIVNLHRQEEAEYTLEVGASPLTSIGTMNVLMGEGDIVPPTLTNGGGFADYKPLEVLPPRSSMILEFVP